MRSYLALLTAAVALAATQAPAAGGRGGPVVHGYPYAPRCPGAGIRDVVDRWGMYACNCTSYVAWALEANGQRTDWFIPGAMNAWNWPHVARLAGLRVDRSPTVGSVAVWPRLAPPFGHVAYVTAVDSSGFVAVAEYNLPGPTGKQTYAFDTRRFVPVAGALFIHVPRRARG
ncbi:MAG TPA: CHAP domain-containing protein [Gaiellaceae bacterium]|nr:CHAP domain-containing protein [Gaiellaceae bacterium]